MQRVLCRSLTRGVPWIVTTKTTLPLTIIRTYSQNEEPKWRKYARTYYQKYGKQFIITSTVVGSIMTYFMYKKSKEFFSPYANTKKSATAELETKTTIQDLPNLEDVESEELKRPPITAPISLVIYVVSKTYWFVRLTMRVLHLGLIFSPALAFFVVQHYLFPSQYENWCKFLALTMQSAGPCFIKLAQWAGTRRDLFGDMLCHYLSMMHTHAPAHSLRKTRQIIQQEFGLSIEEMFDHFNKEPLASGAIAQVYVAKLKNSNYCAVKIRHPKVVQLIARDLTILQFFTKLVSYYPPLRWLNLTDNIKVFSKSMQAQTDLKVEGENLKLFQANFSAFQETIRFPEPHSEKSTSQVLIESFEHGTNIEEYLEDTEHIKFSPELKKQIAQYGINMFLKMMLVDNFVHADLHPGNLMVRMNQRKDTNKYEPQLVVLDVGLVTKLSEHDRVNFMDLFAAVASGDGERAATLMIERARNAKEIIRDPESIKGFKEEMSSLISTVLITPVRELEVGNILEQVLSLGRKYKVSVESNFTTLVLGTIIVEGIGKQLNPDLNFVDAAKPFLVKDPAMIESYIRGRLSHKTDWWRVWKWI